MVVHMRGRLRKQTGSNDSSIRWMGTRKPHCSTNTETQDDGIFSKLTRNFLFSRRFRGSRLYYLFATMFRSPPASDITVNGVTLTASEAMKKMSHLDAYTVSGTDFCSCLKKCCKCRADSNGCCLIKRCMCVAVRR